MIRGKQLPFLSVAYVADPFISLSAPAGEGTGDQENSLRLRWLQEAGHTDYELNHPEIPVVGNVITVEVELRFPCLAMGLTL